LQVNAWYKPLDAHAWSVDKRSPGGEAKESSYPILSADDWAA